MDDIRNRDDDDVIGLSRKKQPESEQDEEYIAPFEGITEMSSEILGAGITGVIGISAIKGIGELLNKR